RGEGTRRRASNAIRYGAPPPQLYGLERGGAGGKHTPRPRPRDGSRDQGRGLGSYEKPVGPSPEDVSAVRDGGDRVEAVVRRTPVVLDQRVRVEVDADAVDRVEVNLRPVVVVEAAVVEAVVELHAVVQVVVVVVDEVCVPERVGVVGAVML